ncbi:MAG: hypothetical protein IKU40_11780 [Clostridia bacterium]|nr:hypothetical protein [Clostridia bacterium]
MCVKFLLILFCILSLFSCGKETETVPEPEILTNIFRGTALELPDEYTLTSGTLPFRDTDSDEVTVLCQAQDHLALVTVYPNGSVGEAKTLDIDPQTVSRAVITGEALYYLELAFDSETFERSYFLHKFHITDGTETVSDELSEHFMPGDSLRISGMAVTADGLICLSSEMEMVALNSMFGKEFVVASSDYIRSLNASPDGQVYACGYFSGSQGFVPINPAVMSYGQKLNLPKTADSLCFGGTDGYDLFWTGTNGVYGWNKSENKSTLLLDFNSSSLLSNNLDLLYIYDSDRILAAERDDNFNYTLMLYERVPDVDLSAIPTLEIAYADCNNNLRKNIVAFNKAHTDVRIVEKNYSADGTDAETAVRNLTNDILNGLYKPDIVTAETVNELIVQLYRSDLYTDLYPLMGEELKNDLLGCVTRTFETDTGELWAIGTDLMIDTLVGPRKILGNRTGWTVTEMIELAKSLPEDMVLYESLNKQQSLSSWLGQNWHRLFIDEETNTCRFDSEEFIGLLEYLGTLPNTWEDAAKLLADYRETGVRWAPHQTGHVALAPDQIWLVSSWVTREHTFFDSNLVRIGYPTAEGQNGSTVDMIPYVITSFCEIPDLAWDFIESILLPDNFQTFGACLPVLRSQVEQICTDAYELYWDVSPNGGVGGSTLAYAYEIHPGDIRYIFTERHERELIDFLDNIAGQPISTISDDVIADILSEEITSFFGGTKTAEECADIVQSRVSIYLSENE